MKNDDMNEEYFYCHRDQRLAALPAHFLFSPLYIDADVLVHGQTSSTQHNAGQTGSVVDTRPGGCA